MSGPGDSTSSKVLLEELLRLYSDLSAAHRELESKNAQLEALDTAKNQLIGIVAHDLRNPIGIIQSYAGFLLADAAPHLAPADVEALRIIHQQASFLLRMVSDLLDFAAIESGRLELRPQCDDFVALVEQVVERNRVLAEPKNIAIELDTGSAAPPVLFDGHRIEQVLNNLIGNAVKFSPAGAPVRVEVACDSTGAVVSIQDHGPGIPPEELETLFQPFQRSSVAPPDGEPGTGLGLAISRRIVEAHGGRVWAESEPGVGSVFRFSIPASEPEAARCAGGPTPAS